jgi:hypothetical protein
MTMFPSKIKDFFAAVVLLCFFTPLFFPLIADSTENNTLPTIRLSGELDNTPRTVMLCKPLTIQFSVTNTGTVPISSGTISLAIKAAGTSRSVFARQLPFTTDANSIMIENVDFPQGEYTLTLKAAVVNKELSINREYTLAEQPLMVSAPILVTSNSSSVPRVLLWLSRTGTPLQRVFAEKIVKEAFDGEGVYSMIVDTAEAFTNQVMSGDFNTAVLFETDELLDRSDWLQDHVAHGMGLVVIGPEDKTRMTAETFGFKFLEMPTMSPAMLLLTDDSGMELSGTVPVSGRILLPQKKSAKPAALLAGDKKPAVLIDTAGNGRVIVMPFSLIRSSLDAGTTSLYSLLLRAAVHNAAPENDELTGVSSIELLVSAPSGPVRTRVVETLPAGTRVIWTNAEGTVKNNTILYDLIADKEPQRLLYVYQPPAGSKTPIFSEVFFECNENLVSQGKIE